MLQKTSSITIKPSRYLTYFRHPIYRIQQQENPNLFGLSSHRLLSTKSVDGRSDPTKSAVDKTIHTAATSAGEQYNPYAHIGKPSGSIWSNLFPHLFPLSTVRVSVQSMNDEQWSGIGWIFGKSFRGTLLFEIIQRRFGSEDAQHSMFYDRNGNLVGYDLHKTTHFPELNEDAILTQAATLKKGGGLYVTYETIRYLVSAYINNLFKFILTGTSVDITYLSPNINLLSSILFMVLYGGQPHVVNQLWVETNELMRVVTLASKIGWKYRPDVGFIVFETGNNPKDRVVFKSTSEATKVLSELHDRIHSREDGLAPLFWFPVEFKPIAKTLMNVVLSQFKATKRFMQQPPQKEGDSFVDLITNRVVNAEGEHVPSKQKELEAWAQSIVDAQKEQQTSQVGMRR